MSDAPSMNGWIKLHRKFQSNFLWTERRKFSKAEAWIDILMEARHDPEPARILMGNCLVECYRGQCVKSLDTWARRWGWSKAAVRRFFDLLQNADQIRYESVTKTTRISVCNYDTYNDVRNANETQMKRTRNAPETHLKPNKNEENEKNERKDTPQPPKGGDSNRGKLIAHGEFQKVKLSEAEYKKLCDKHGKERTDAGIAELDAWMESTGKRRKNHYACLSDKSWVWEKVAPGAKTATAAKPIDHWQAKGEDVDMSMRNAF